MTNQSRAGRFSVRTMLAVVIVFVLIVASFTTTVVADTFIKYDVMVIDNANETTISTNETEPIEILRKAGITLNNNDKLDITGFTEGEGGIIKISRQNTIHIDFDKRISAHKVYSTTVGAALNEIGVTVKDGIKSNYAMTDSIVDGMVIELKTPFYVTLDVDSSKAKYAITEGRVSDLIAFAGIELSEEDYTKPGLDAKLCDNMKVTVYRVEYKTETAQEDVKFKTKKIKDSSLCKGIKKTVVKGVKGKADVTYNVKYVNGKPVSKEKIKTVITKKPVQAKVKVGTKEPKGAGSVKANGVTTMNGYTVGQEINGRYSHYCACATCNGNSRGITTSGKRIRNGMANPYYIACNWLPLGTVINVDGKNYTVVDRGGRGLSRVGRIDIFTPGGHSECYRRGVGSCKITIVRLGW